MSAGLSAAGGAGASAVRILIVDDDEFDRLSVRRCLQQSGIEASVDEATTAADVMQMVRPGAYDCVLLDYYLPGADTVSLVRHLLAEAAGTPVVIFTGRGDEEVAVELMKAGAADYLPKASLTPQRLATSLRYATGVARSAAERRRVEQSLREREAEFRTLANAIPQMAWIADSDGRRYWYNERWYEFSGLRPDQCLGLGWQLLHHPDHRERVCNGQLAAFARGEAWEDTFPLRRKDGVYRWFLARAVPIRGEGAPRWIGTHTDVTERLEAEQALAASEERLTRLLAAERQAREEAERATQARDDVLAIVAHDLRNPMHTIMAAASMLALTADEEKRERQIAIVQRSISDMQRLIGDLLDVARIESGTFTVQCEPLDVHGLIADALDRFESQAAARDVRITSTIEADVRPVHADRDRLIQVLSNLLGNALKFAPAGTSVSLRAEMAVEEVRLSVKDSGSGIPAEHLPHVFDRYWQADRASRAGAGLGLAICKGIVEAHGGRIWAASAVGRGTTIHFTLRAIPS